MSVLAACHAHSVWSYDGSWTIPDLAKEFKRRGYRVLMLTEHDRNFSSEKLARFRDECRANTTRDLLIVPGIEYSDITNTLHILTWGDVPFLGENQPTDRTLRAVQDAGGVSVFAHPSRRNAWQLFNPEWAEFLLGIELWNRKTDGWRPSGRAPALIESSNVVPFVGLDFHTIGQMFPLGMALQINGTLTEESVVDCLKARRCEARAFGAALGCSRAKVVSFSMTPIDFVRRAFSWSFRRIGQLNTRARMVKEP
jgi:hypothetical protein